jgi:hypothetical protein
VRVIGVCCIALNVTLYDIGYCAVLLNSLDTCCVVCGRDLYRIKSSQVGLINVSNVIALHLYPITDYLY